VPKPHLFHVIIRTIVREDPFEQLHLLLYLQRGHLEEEKNRGVRPSLVQALKFSRSKEG
jgi:hypothetical protein